MMGPVGALFSGLTAIAGVVLATCVQAAPSVAAADWNAYKQKFVDPGGRIIDDANGDISHSEGQGYGMLLAYLADNRADFDLIWSFTRTELLLRDDGLAAWKWDPATSPHVSDANNATDGDILIAYALGSAGKTWEQPDFTAASTSLIKAIAASSLAEREGRLLVMPAAQGFAASDRADGPVVNLSYWVFEAFPLFAALDLQTDWAKVNRDGIELLGQAGAGSKRLPPDWLSLHTRPKPAQGFTPEFGYNALRIPLYLLRAGAQPDMLRPFSAAIGTNDALILANLDSNVAESELTDPGYRIIAALIDCALNGKRVPDDLRTFAPTAYYPSTLHLLGLSYLADRPGECR